jgi:hypothetical protein
MDTVFGEIYMDRIYDEEEGGFILKEWVPVFIGSSGAQV